jgi:hypothetical protein
MIALNQIQVVEFSVSQNAYHVETMDEMLKTNLGAIENKKSIDYVPIGFFDNYESAAKFIDWHEKVNPLRKQLLP